MLQKLNLILIFITIQFGCSQISKQNVVSVNNQISSTPKNLTLADNYKRRIYRDLVADAAIEPSLVLGEEYPYRKYPKLGSSLVYRIETILPENIEIVNKLPDLPSTIAKLFIEVNQKTEYLDKEYSIMRVWTASCKGDRDLIKFYAQVRKSCDSVARGVVAFSNIAVDETHKYALVYREYYGVDRTLKKNYLLLTLEKDENNKVIDDIQYVVDIKVMDVPES